MQREQQERWELARWICWQEMLLSPNIKAVDKPKTAKGYCLFPWEKADEEIPRKTAISDAQERMLWRLMEFYDKENKTA